MQERSAERGGAAAGLRVEGLGQLYDLGLGLDRARHHRVSGMGSRV